MHRTLCFALVLAIGSLFLGTARGELNETEFARLHKLLTPSDQAAWRTIPWKIAVLDAQALAAEQQKPIFIWAMDGHPLGCT